MNAAPIAIVEELQMPVSLERGQQRIPLRAGMQLKEFDTLETSETGRLVALFVDGSLLKVQTIGRFTAYMSTVLIPSWKPEGSLHASKVNLA